MLEDSDDVVLDGNRINGNAATHAGGLYLYQSAATVTGNTVASNTAATRCGGISLDRSAATLSVNAITSNAAGLDGGGVCMDDTPVTFIGNTIARNTARQWGGGLSGQGSDSWFTGNIFASNVAGESGGGLYITGDATLVNTVVVKNTADNHGAGIYISNASPHLLHTTVACNTGGDGSGIHVHTDYDTETPSTATLTNTILVSQSVGIIVTEWSTATLEGTLWGAGAWANGQDYAANGSITHTHDITGTPAFVAPDAHDYHIGPDSAAIDRGVSASATTDIDGQPRPAGFGHDIGADEYYYPALAVSKKGTPNPVQAGATLTYTIYVTNTGNVDLHATVTDTLPAGVTSSSILTWTPVIPFPGGVWMQTVTRTVAWSYAGLLTNVVQVTAEEGITGAYTETTTAQVSPALTVSKMAEPDPVQAGSVVTFTVQITNTGNIDLHATVTDELPAHVVPGSSITWTPTITAPGGTWTQTLTRTVAWGYAGPLTNVVQVSTEEGATGAYPDTITVQVTPALAVTKVADPDPVQAGAQMTYTIRITNTGNVTLTAVVTDVLPGHVTPTGTFTWTPAIAVPGGVWAQVIVVTVDKDYIGPLSNTVWVTTEEGATGTSSATITVIRKLYFPLMLRNP